ncbi:MAG: SDR family NAD(P)-dependent oxidoreductase [Gemmatimonadales bacterium]|nr:MAG: SDR family NAD(P)-dependent oxidoreductase [Gemmatimonadales bacterium]
MGNWRVCFITGASSGLGMGLAIRLAKDGYAVGLAARRESKLEEVAGRVREQGGTAAIYPCDVSQRDQVTEAVRRCEEELGPVELLVANAGVSVNTRVEAFDAGEVERVIRINLLGAVYATDAVLAGMLERGRGQIVAVSSIAGFAGLPMSAAYSASKGGMTNFFESLRIDLRGTGVDVTVIMPGFVKTPMTSHNRHRMPFLMDLGPAVELMVRAIRKRKKSLAYPWPMAAVAWTARLLPRPAYDWLASRVDRGKTPEAGGPPGDVPGTLPDSRGYRR